MRVALVSIVLCGCASLRSKADDAYASGNYLAAQELYDKIARTDPHDTAAVARRDDARNAVLRVLLFHAESERAAHHDREAAAKLRELLARRDAWKLAVDPRLVPEIGMAVDETATWLTDVVRVRAISAGPLAGERFARDQALLDFADFAATKRAIAAELVAVGQARCAALDTATPYARWLVAKYCAHFDVTREVPALTHGGAGLAVEGSIAGETQNETAALGRALANAFAESPWFDPGAAKPAPARLDGTIAATFSSRSVTRTKTWIEAVSYTEYVDEQEAYDEPYTDTEMYTESVPSTEYQDTSCSDPPCPQQAVTVYHDETRTRAVTKYRTAYRTVTKPVTKYVDETRSFDYQAIERVATYASVLRVQTPHGVASIDAKFSGSGDDHDVTNSAAGVYPSRANLMTIGAFVEREQGRLAARLRDVLDERWGAAFCTRTTYTVEDAATCAYRTRVPIPAAAHAALVTLLGGDEPYL